MADKWEGWTCIPGRVCGGSQFMRDAESEIARLRETIRDLQNATTQFLTYPLGMERKSLEAVIHESYKIVPLEDAVHDEQETT